MTPITPQEIRKEAEAHGKSCKWCYGHGPDGACSRDPVHRRVDMLKAGADALEFTCGQCGNTAAQGHKLDCRLAAGYTSRLAEALEEVGSHEPTQAR